MRSSADGNRQGVVFVELGGIPVRRVVAPLVRRLQQVCLSVIADTLRDSGLVQLEYALLVFVDDVPGISQQTLSEALGIDRNYVSLLAEGLEARGLLKRAVDGDDRRVRKLYLTPEGRKLWRECRPKIRAANDRILSCLGADEKELFLNMLVRVLDANKLHARPGGGRRKRDPAKTAKAGRQANVT